MIAAGNGGSIIFIASMSGSIVNYPQEQSCYNASKAAVIQLGKSLAAEWAQHNVRVNCISPGYMDTALNRVPALDAQKKIWTSMTPQNRLGNVDELNNLAVFLATDASSFMTGSNCVVDVRLPYFSSKVFTDPSTLGRILGLLDPRTPRTTPSSQSVSNSHAAYRDVFGVQHRGAGLSALSLEFGCTATRGKYRRPAKQRFTS